MKKLLSKNSLIAVLIAFALAFTALGVVTFSGNNGTVDGFCTKGVYTAFADQSVQEDGDLIKDVKTKISNDGKYLLLVAAFDDANLKSDGLYYIGYTYTFNYVEVDTTQLEGAKTSTYYASVVMNTTDGAQSFSASDIYANADYDGYGLIVYEIEFPTNYLTDGGLLWNVSAFINEVEQNEQSGYDVVNAYQSNVIENGSKFQLKNGNFENGLEGWTRINTYGEKSFAGIDQKETFWGEGYAMNNTGKYFSSYADDSDESAMGYLVSDYFTVGGSGWAMYKFGGAGNQKCYITVEDENGQVVALYRNTKFADFNGDFTLEERKAMIGDTVFLANFVTYKVDLSAYLGQKLRFVVNDYASSNWGVVFFDELNTYCANAESLPKSAVIAENLLANKTALNEQLKLEVTEQGDYTLDSYNNYLSALENAKVIAAEISATQTDVDQAVTTLSTAYQNLTVRPIEEVDGAIKSFRLTSNSSKEINIVDYVNANGLSNVTYQVSSSEQVVTISEIIDGKFTVSAGQVEGQVDAIVTIKALYGEEEKLSVQLNVQVSNELAPTLYAESVEKDYDIYDLENKTNVVIDFASNVDNAGNLALTYSAKYGEQDLVLDGSAYTFTFGAYTDEVTVEEFNVTVAFTANGVSQTISYVYKLNMIDSTAYRMVNGGFEDGLTGWTKVGNIGDVDTATHYWVGDAENAEGYTFGMDGEKMFSAYAPGATEAAVGTLTSPSFKIGGSGFVTFKIGALRDCNYCYVDVVEKSTGKILARYYNGLWAERDANNVKSGCTLVAYKADLSEFDDKEVFFRISDNADSGYGLFFADSFVTYYQQEPENFNYATTPNYQGSPNYNEEEAEYLLPETIYDLMNGGFEMGNVEGWWNVGEPGAVTNADAFFSGVAYGKVGTYLYSGVEDYQAGNGREGNVGTLTSSAFLLGGNGYITYMLGGGNAFCYVQVIDSTTGEILARYRQQAREDAVLKKYVADLSAYIGRTIRIQVVDNATNNWGCVSFDDVITYYTSVPEGITAIDVKYEIVNGSFEDGLENSYEGWKMNITEAGGQNTLGWVVNTEHEAGWYTKNNDRKDGDNLFTFVKADGTNCENTKGTLDSACFVLKSNSFVSFRFGGAGTRDVNVQLCAADGTVIATFYNEAEGKVNTEMYAYYYQYTGETRDCFFRVYDNSTSNYGCFVVDDFRVNLESAPENFIAAIIQ